MENEKNTGENFENENTTENIGAIESSEKKAEGKGPMKELLEWVQAIAIAIVLAMVIRSFVFTVVRVDGQSMESTLHHNDRLIVWKLLSKPESGDIVVFRSAATNNNYWIKRVIATEGQHVKIDFEENSVYVDGEKIDEPYINDDPMSGDNMEYSPHRDMYTDLTVPQGCVFVLGDNRNHSSDGRYIGPVSVDSIEGEAKLRFWPLGSIEVY